jgi:hypothetical protein
MLTITRAQIDAVRLSTELGPRVCDSPVKASSEMSDADYDHIEDACIDALISDAPVVEEFEAEQDKGVYSVIVQGVPGAYIVFAPEYDHAGVFSSMDEALSYVDVQYGEFLIQNSGEVEEEEEEEHSDSDNE